MQEQAQQTRCWYSGPSQLGGDTPLSGPLAMRQHMLATLLSFGLLGASAIAGTTANESPMENHVLTAIPALDVARYMGTWYEIAKYPNRFQKKCTAGTKADYSLGMDGRVTVRNQCRVADGGLSEVIGEAKQIGSSTSPKLQVRFAPAWLSLLPFVWADYWVIAIDDDYQLAAVSEPQKEYLWILSRTPKVDPVRYNRLLNQLQEKNFDLQKLETTQQD